MGVIALKWSTQATEQRREASPDMDTRDLARQAIAAALPRQQAVARKRTAVRRVLRTLKVSVMTLCVLTALPLAGHYAIAAWQLPVPGLTPAKAPAQAPVLAAVPPSTPPATDTPRLVAEPVAAPVPTSSASPADSTESAEPGLQLRRAQSLSLIPAITQGSKP